MKITIPPHKTSLYEALNLISEQADCSFIYDSKVVDNDKRVKLEADHLSLRQVLDKLLEDPAITYRVVGKHILICRTNQDKQAERSYQPIIAGLDTSGPVFIRGVIIDQQTRDRMPYASIGIEGQNLGTISNSDGFFHLKVPAELSDAKLVVSHLGYASRKIPIALLREEQVEIQMNRRVISIQEVIIRYQDPLVIIRKAMQQRSVNYNTHPVFLTTFYREGVQKNQRLVNYAEAVFKVYKSEIEFDDSHDRVKLLKSRKVQSPDPNDTVLLKLKAGILAGLQLDIVKSPTEFLQEAELNNYTLTYSDMVSFNDLDAWSIGFEQRPYATDVLYKGTLYISRDDFAILGAEFDVSPAYLLKASNDLVQKKSRKLNVRFESIHYSVSYKEYQGTYYLNHVRSDLKIRTRLKHHLSSDVFDAFMEIATCAIDTLIVQPFAKDELIHPEIVFSDAYFGYDDAFWGDFNTIAPEAQLDEALLKMAAKLEKIR